jgi:2-oxoglutarate dehydrogenase E1 component
MIATNYATTLIYFQSWDIFFRNATEGAPPGSAYVAPPSIRTGMTGLTTSMGAVTQPGVVDTKLIDDHLAVQAIIRAYQVCISKIL